MRISKPTDSELLALIAVMGLLFVIGGAWLGESFAGDGFKVWRLVSTVIVTIAGGAVVSVMVAFAILRYKDTGARKARAQLAELLGVSNLSHEVAIVLPRFPPLHGDQNGTPIAAKDYVTQSLAVKDSRLTNKYSLAFDDIAAARHISAIFVELGIAPPRIEFDDDARESLFGPRIEEAKLRDYKSFIVVGLYSNEVTMNLAKIDDVDTHRCFRLSGIEEFYAGSRGVSFCPKDENPAEWRTRQLEGWDVAIKSAINEDPVKLERHRDFALISTCFSPDGRPCMIIGGARSRGSRKAASYFRSNWKQIFAEVRKNGASHTRAPGFVEVFDLLGDKGAKLRPRGGRKAFEKTES